MKTPKISYIYNRKGTASEKKAAAVEIRVTYERKSKYVGTGVSLLQKEWKEGKVIGRMDAPYLQKCLDKLYERVCKVVGEMMEEGCINLAEIPSRMKEMERQGMSFLDFCEEKIEVRTHGLRQDTKERYERFMKFLRAFGKIGWFPDITEKNLLLLDAALDKKGMLAKSKWHNYHRFLNSFIIDAIDEGLLKKNPYKALRLDKGDDSVGIEKYLTSDEFKKVCKCKCPLPSVEKARDLFIFQVYTCMAYADLAQFDPKNIKEDRKKRKIYTGKRQKTGQEYTFLMMPEAMRILDKYDGQLPIVSNQKYNDALKMLSVYAKVNKVISSHWARHTGATLLLNAGVDMEVVAKILGHSSTRITRAIYAKLLDSTVADAMERVKI